MTPRLNFGVTGYGAYFLPRFQLGGAANLAGRTSFGYADVLITLPMANWLFFEPFHRDHAVVEQVFADWAGGPLAHLPSGSFPANAAWLALAAIAHNLLRAAGALASLACAKARGATLRRGLIDVAARAARHGHGEITLHLPEGWHRQTEWMNLFEAAYRPTRPSGLTSPDPVTAPPRPRRAASQDPAKNLWTKPQKCERQENHAHHPAPRSVPTAQPRKAIT